MALTRNLFFLFAITVFAVTSTILAVFNYDPFHSNSAVFINFYISLLVGLAGIFALIIYFAKVRWSKNQTVFSYFWPSVRQATFLSSALTIILFLRGLRILDWLIGISVIVVFTLLELFFESKKRNK